MAKKVVKMTVLEAALMAIKLVGIKEDGYKEKKKGTKGELLLMRDGPNVGTSNWTKYTKDVLGDKWQGSSWCFPAGVKVKVVKSTNDDMPPGPNNPLIPSIEEKPIEEIVVGDRVITLGNETALVTATSSREANNLRKVYVKPVTSTSTNIKDAKKIICTGEHPFYVSKKGNFIVNGLQREDFESTKRSILNDDSFGSFIAAENLAAGYPLVCVNTKNPEVPLIYTAEVIQSVNYRDPDPSSSSQLVYNIETDQGVYIADDFYVHNCNISIWWVYTKIFGKELGMKLLCAPKFDALATYTPTTSGWFKDNNQYIYTHKRYGKKQSKEPPKAGDIIYFYRYVSNEKVYRICHVGYVYLVKDGVVYTCEGNTSPGPDVVANGGMVRCKAYPLNYDGIDGYGRPAYEKILKPEHAPMIIENLKKLGVEIPDVEYKFVV